MEFSIKPVTLDNLDDIMRIEEKTRPDHHWSRDSFAAELQNSYATYRCAFDRNERAMGYYGIWKIFEEAHLTTLAVDPDFRRRKIATRLMFDLIDVCYADMIKYDTLEVRESNVPAISLYEKFGFVSIGVRKNYYQDNNENALIMFTENIFYDKFKNNLKKLKNEFGDFAK